MGRLLPIEDTPDSTGRVNFLVDYTWKRYVRLPGMNTDSTIARVHAFLCKYDVFGSESQVMRQDRMPDYVPEGTADYSCVLNFYNLIISSRARLAHNSQTGYRPSSEEIRQTKAQLNHVGGVGPDIPLTPTSMSEDEDTVSSSDSEEMSGAWKTVVGLSPSAPRGGSRMESLKVTNEISEDSESSPDSSVTESLHTESETESSEPEPTPPPKRRRSTKSKKTSKSKSKSKSKKKTKSN